MVQDPDCRGICLFLETIRHPENFFAACDAAMERGKPVVVLKTGKTEASLRAAEAHSGALAVPDRLIDARFRRHGVIRVESLEEMLETAIALQSPIAPAGGGLATTTGSGGQIELVLDAAEPLGLVHASLRRESIDRIRAILPDFLHVKNPLDWWGVENEATDYPELTRALAEDPGVDIVIAVVDQTTQPTGHGRVRDRGRAGPTVSRTVRATRISRWRVTTGTRP
jgi:acetate---CoA ligase (ADP-forming)